MDTPSYDRRIRILALLSGLALLVLVGRLWMLQLTEWVKYAERAAGNRMDIVWEPAARGMLLDREGRVLASNRERWRVVLVSSEYPQDKEATRHISLALASVLDEPEPTVAQALAAAAKLKSPEAVPLGDLGEELTLEQVARLEALAVELPGIQVGSEVRRYYPEGKLAAHLLGYARSITADQMDRVKALTYPARNPLDIPPRPWEDRVYDNQSVAGQGGVEDLLELGHLPSGGSVPLLQGRRGYRIYEVNRERKPQWTIAEREAVPGAMVYLTLDLRLQKVAEQALDEALDRSGSQEGAVVVLDPRNGDVLVMASRPTFDPNQWVRGLKPEEWKALQSGGHQPLLNRPMAGLYPPGSIFKMISAYAALATTKAKPGDHYYCGGRITHGLRHDAFRCWKRTGHGMVGFYQGIAQSCDIYFYNLVLSRGLTSDTLAEYSRRFGLGSPTGLGLAGEPEGRVPDRRWKQEVKQEAWFSGDTLHFVIGQGFLTVTPLQMAVVTAAVANGGFRLEPRLVHRIVWPQWLGYGVQEFTQPRGQDLKLDSRILGEVRQGLREAVSSRNGTAAAVRGLGVAVAGKTGSAEHQPDKKPHAWFVCYAPVEKPRYVVCVLVAESGHGGAIAAPVARQILAAAFGTSGGASEQPESSD